MAEVLSLSHGVCATERKYASFVTTPPVKFVKNVK